MKYLGVETIELAGRTVKLDVNGEAPDAQLIERFLDQLATHAATAKSFIDEDDPTVKEFLEFHLEELEPEILATLIDKTSAVAPMQQLLGKLVLERVGIYPDDEQFAVFDHTFEGNTLVDRRRTITDQIIAVYLDANGVALNLSHES